MVTTNLAFNLGTHCTFNVMNIDVGRDFGLAVLTDLDPRLGPSRQQMFMTPLQVHNEGTLIGMEFYVTGENGSWPTNTDILIAEMQPIDPLPALLGLPHVSAVNAFELNQALLGNEDGSQGESED